MPTGLPYNTVIYAYQNTSFYFIFGGRTGSSTVDYLLLSVTTVMVEIAVAAVVVVVVTATAAAAAAVGARAKRFGVTERRSSDGVAFQFRLRRRRRVSRAVQ